MSVINDGLPVSLVVHRVQESAVVVDHLVSVAHAQGFPFHDHTGIERRRLRVRTEYVRQIWADTTAPGTATLRRQAFLN